MSYGTHLKSDSGAASARQSVVPSADWAHAIAGDPRTVTHQEYSRNGNIRKHWLSTPEFHTDEGFHKYLGRKIAQFSTLKVALLDWMTIHQGTKYEGRARRQVKRYVADFREAKAQKA